MTMEFRLFFCILVAMFNSFILEKFAQVDFDLYYELVRDEHVMAMITERVIPLEEAKSDFEKIVQNTALHPSFGYFKIIAREDGRFVGLAKLEIETPDSWNAELGYMLLPAYWGMGIGSTVARQLIEIAKLHVQLHKLTAIIDPSNIASRKILINNGFVSQGCRNFDGLPGEVLTMDIS